jgi:hypothetical protein
MRTSIQSIVIAGCAAGVLFTACANNPVYIPAPDNLEAGMVDAMGMITAEAKASLVLPVKLETVDDAAKRAARATALGIDVPYVKIGDLEVSIEWTIKNLDAVPGQAKIELNGANEYFLWDPSTMPVDPASEAPPTPALDGDVPIDVPASGEVSGLFREDQVVEASIDLDQITRGNLNPFTATLTISKNLPSFQPMTALQPAVMGVVPPQMPMGPAIPREAFAQMTQYDLVFKPDHHMVLEFAVRVRDIRGIMDDLLLSAPPAELTQFMPAPYAVAPPAP